jgi:adenylyl-sulfate kinase
LALVFWFTGLSGAGKTTIADAAAAVLEQNGIRVRILDGDVVRAQLHKHLGFSEADILENNRLIADLCVDALPNADVVLVPIISPLEAGRRNARINIGDAFRLVYFNAGLDHVAAADVKGLYRRARDGEIDNMIGVAESNPYESPTDVDFEIDISAETRETSVDRFIAYVRDQLNER